MQPLLSFMLPVMAALFLQAMYGAVDLLVGKRGQALSAPKGNSPNPVGPEG